jgi:genome maintenance exonuclease 1
LFQLDLLVPDYVIRNKDTPDGRFYQLPSGNWVPSVTTKLGKYFDKSEVLEAWRDRIGHEAAAKKTRQGAARGTALHNLVEKYVLGEDWKKGVFPHTMSHFYQIKGDLDEHISAVQGVEIALWDEYIRTAGRSDLICTWKGKRTVLDIKTATTAPRTEWIKNYFVQATCYSYMVEQRLGYPIEQIVILMACDKDCRQLWEFDLTQEMRDEMVEIMRNTDIPLPENFDAA